MPDELTLANILAGDVPSKNAFPQQEQFPHGYPRFPNLDPRAYSGNALSKYGELPIWDRMYPGLLWALLGARAGGPTGFRGDWMGDYMRMMNEPPPTLTTRTMEQPAPQRQSQQSDPTSFLEMWSRQNPRR